MEGWLESLSEHTINHLSAMVVFASIETPPVEKGSLGADKLLVTG